MPHDIWRYILHCSFAYKIYISTFLLFTFESFRKVLKYHFSLTRGKNETPGHNETVVLLWVPKSTWTRVCEITSRELEAILLNHQQENDKKKPWCEWKGISFMCDLLIFSSLSFSYEFGNLLNYFWGDDLSFFSLLIKLFEHFNLSILRISSHFKWEFSWIPKMWWYYLLFCVGQMRHQNFHWVEDLVVVFYF